MDQEALAARVALLERQLRFFRRIGLVAVVLASCLVLMGQAAPESDMRASRFVLVTPEGDVRGEWSIQTDASMLTLYDHHGGLVLRLGSWDGRTVLEYRDHKGEMRNLAAPPGVQRVTP